MEYIEGTIIKSEEEGEYAAPGFYTDSGDYLAFTILTHAGESVNVWMPPCFYEREKVETSVGSFISAYMEPLHGFDDVFLIVDASNLFYAVRNLWSSLSFCVNFMQYEKYTESEEAYVEAVDTVRRHARTYNQVDTAALGLYR